MRKNPGRKDARLESQAITRQKGDLNRTSTHKMRTHDGMTKGSNPQFKMTLNGLVKI